MTTKRNPPTKNTKATAAARGAAAQSRCKKCSLNDSTQKTASAAKPSTKLRTCLDLLGRKTGATLNELMVATGWQAHSVRGFLSGTVRKKLGLSVTSIQGRNGVRHYVLAPNREVA